MAKKKCKAALDARKDVLTWKDEYFVFCFYVRAGVTQEFCALIFSIADGSVSDIFYAWMYLIDAALCEMFPCLSRSQML